MDGYTILANCIHISIYIAFIMDVNNNSGIVDDEIILWSGDLAVHL